MIRPIPPGTRDVLPDEMRELRAIQSALLGTFERAGFREVRTPTLEYADALELGDGNSAGSAYRFFDERGELLALRTDMTIPIARLVADRYRDIDPPHRLSYFANAYRAVTPQRGELREFGQAGVELIGVPGHGGTAEVVELLDRSLSAVGLGESVIGLGHSQLWTSLLEDIGASPDLTTRVSGLLVDHDLVGVEVGGAVKNVLAIATGLCDGLDLGLNARAALITRGLAEMTRLGLALGARADTFMGLSGLGDLVLTATGDLSRNRQVGLLLAAGQSLQQAVDSLGHVAEGVYSARTVVQRARLLGIEMPISEAVVALLDGQLQPAEAVAALMGRGPKGEMV